MNGLSIPLLFVSLISGELEETQAFVSGHEFRVEIADTPFSQMRGLMGRDRLEADTGMLFVYDDDRHVQFWMKGVSFPLDMIFFDRCGDILKIHADAQPDDPAIVSSDEPVRAVLELQAGASKRAQMRPGERVVVGRDVFDVCD